MAMIDYSNQNWESYFEKEVQAYQLAKSIGAAYETCVIGHILEEELLDTKLKNQAVAMLELSLQIAQQAHLPCASEIAQLLTDNGVSSS